MPDLEYRAKLRNSTDASDQVIFRVSPELVETRNVNYKTVDPIHAPGQIYAFVNSSSRTFNLSGIKLISRTREEAQTNLIILWRLRSWTLPAFGKDPVGSNERQNRVNYERELRKASGRFTPGSAGEASEIERLQSAAKRAGGFGEPDIRGMPPSVLEFSAYAHDGHYGTAIGHINRVPVVITSLNIPFPVDTDYFPTASGVPMPTIMNIDLTLAETHSPKEYEQFSLSAFKSGTLGGF